MTEGERIIALLTKIDARLGQIEHALCGESLYTVAENGVLTRVRSPSQITEGSTTSGDILDIPTFLRRKGLSAYPGGGTSNVHAIPIPGGIPEGGGSL